MGYEIIVNAPVQNMVTARGETYDEIEEELRTAIEDKSLRSYALYGARDFIIRQVETGRDLLILSIDENLDLNENTAARIAERRILVDEYLLPDTLDHDFDEWAELNGLDTSFYGGPDVPGTADLYDAGMRILARQEIGRVMTVRANYIEGELNDTYAGFTVEGFDGREETFFHEGLTEDFRDAKRWAETKSNDLIIDRSVLAIGDEPGFEIVFDDAMVPEIRTTAPDSDPSP